MRSKEVANNIAFLASRGVATALFNLQTTEDEETANGELALLTRIAGLLAFAIQVLDRDDEDALGGDDVTSAVLAAIHLVEDGEDVATPLIGDCETCIQELRDLHRWIQDKYPGEPGPNVDIALVGAGSYILGILHTGGHRHHLATYKRDILDILELETPKDAG